MPTKDLDANALRALELFVSALRALPGVNKKAWNSMRESAKNFLSTGTGRKCFQGLFDAASRHLGKPHLLKHLNLILTALDCQVVIVHEQGPNSSSLFVVHKLNEVFIIAPSGSFPNVPIHDTASIRSALQTLGARMELNELPKDIVNPPSSQWAGALMEILLSELDNFAALYERGLVDEAYRRNCIHCLRRLSLNFSRLPPSYLRHDSITKGQHVTGGAFADIFVGSINGAEVCIKVLRLYTSQTDSAHRILVKNFCRETFSWGMCDHPNILPFLGVYEDPPSFWLLSPWMKNGSLLHFLEKHSDFDRTKAIIDTAEGMRYLHEHDPLIVHADIRGANILVKDDLRCCLGDFGLSAITEMTVTSTREAGTGPWMAPEIIRGIPEGTSPSPKRDIFAFGSTIFEIFTGSNPFRAIPFKGFAEIWSMQKVVEGVRAEPPAADCFTDKTWELINLCWQDDPTKRPDAREILHSLGVPSSPAYILLRRPEPSLTAKELHAKLRADYEYLLALKPTDTENPSQAFLDAIWAELEPVEKQLDLMNGHLNDSSFRDLAAALNSGIRTPVPHILIDVTPGMSSDAQYEKHNSDRDYLDRLLSLNNDVPRRAFLDAIIQELRAVHGRLTDLELEGVNTKFGKLEILHISGDGEVIIATGFDNRSLFTFSYLFVEPLNIFLSLPLPMNYGGQRGTLFTRGRIC